LVRGAARKAADLAFEVQQASRGDAPGAAKPALRIGEDGQLQMTSEIRPLRVVGRYDRAMVLAEWHNRTRRFWQRRWPPT
jgi:hypothetical protein